MLDALINGVSVHRCQSVSVRMFASICMRERESVRVCGCGCGCGCERERGCVQVDAFCLASQQDCGK